MNLDLRNVHIALAVGTVVLIVGCYLFRNSGEGALQMVALAMLVIGFGTLGFLDARDERRRGGDSQ